MELCQPPLAPDPALGAVELQSQLEQGFLGGKIRAWLPCLVDFLFFWVERSPQPPPISPWISGSHYRGDKGGQGVRRGAGRVTLHHTAQEGAERVLRQRPPLLIPSPCTKNSLGRVLTLLGETPPQEQPVLGLDPFCDPKTPQRLSAAARAVPVQEQTELAG